MAKFPKPLPTRVVAGGKAWELIDDKDSVKLGVCQYNDGKWSYYASVSAVHSSSGPGSRRHISVFKGGQRHGYHQGPSLHISLKPKITRAGVGALWYDWDASSYSADGGWRTIPYTVQQKARKILEDFVAAFAPVQPTPVVPAFQPSTTSSSAWDSDNEFGTYSKTVNAPDEIGSGPGVDVPDNWDD